MERRAQLEEEKQSSVLAEARRRQFLAEEMAQAMQHEENLNRSQGESFGESPAKKRPAHTATLFLGSDQEVLFIRERHGTITLRHILLLVPFMR